MTAHLLAWVYTFQAKVLAPLMLPGLPMDGPDIDYNDQRVTPEVRTFGQNLISNVIYIGFGAGIVMIVWGFIRSAIGENKKGRGLIWTGVALAFVCGFMTETGQWLLGFLKGLTGI